MKLPFEEVPPEGDPFFDLPDGYVGRWAILRSLIPGDPTELFALDVLGESGGGCHWIATFRDVTADGCLERAAMWIDLRRGGLRPLC